MFLVFATYNPSGHSYFHWVMDMESGRWSIKILVGLCLIVLHLTFAYATARAIGAVGVLATTTLFSSAVWALVDLGYLSDLGLWGWVTVILSLLATLLAIGVSWSYIRNRLSGQVDSNDITL
ncbi:MAG: hypothetical protein KJ904_06925 [Alphaproteobacteria bacterium]|nr:hypothetical protein [Alphaproteobacteria bacterium]MBU0797351.1 hypothetical protein [Alphaproteobacteria bacterium]MBU0886881.1 hypothetical protein [Alphaproteobacteria bacterium]MBU1812376.1 hypothetical protein [Alphaproteobacteria bacterium]